MDVAKIGVKDVVGGLKGLVESGALQITDENGEHVGVAFVEAVAERLENPEGTDA